MQGLYALYAFYASYPQAMYYNARFVCFICILCFIYPGDVLQCKACMPYMHFMLHIPRQCITIKACMPYTHFMFHIPGQCITIKACMPYMHFMLHMPRQCIIKFATYWATVQRLQDLSGGSEKGISLTYWAMFAVGTYSIKSHTKKWARGPGQGSASLSLHHLHTLLKQYLPQELMSIIMLN